MLAVLLSSGNASGADDFFENRIRPLLAQKCYACHGSQTAMSGLRLDSKAGWEKGGKRGAAIIPGDTERSILLRAVRHEDATLRMPPGAHLLDSEIEDLTAWIRDGAKDPRIAGTPKTVQSSVHWSFQPVRKPTLPAVRNKSWIANPVDAFILSSLESQGLMPAKPADKRTLLRRVTLDLTGLPPTPDEISAFLADTSSDAYKKVVNRLLASPHYGERWGRHWLDLARFGETSGHEFDSEKPDAWRYRDYVIRAFNEDVPSDQFIRENIAGDLLPRERRSPDGKQIESILGTGFFALHEERNAADDLAEVRSEKTENQIDVLSKTFFGLTVGCARCHDHKFDPIPTADYYGLAGILHSTRQLERNIDSPEQQQRTSDLQQQLATVTEELRRFKQPSPQISEHLLKPDDVYKPILEAAAKDSLNILYPFAKLQASSDQPFAQRLQDIIKELREGAAENEKRGDLVLADFRSGSYNSWQISGPAFGSSPRRNVAPNQTLIGYRGGSLANSFSAGSNAFTGVLTSPRFAVDRSFLHVRLASTPDKTRKREHGTLRFTMQIAGRPAYVNATKENVFEWQTTGVSKAANLTAFLVIADRATDGYIAVEKVVLSNRRDPPRFDIAPNSLLMQMLEQPGIDSLEKLADAYQQWYQRTSESDSASTERDWFLAAFPSRIAETPEAAQLEQRRVAIEKRLQPASYGVVSEEDIPTDSPILVRGNVHDLGPVTPRHFLQVLSKDSRVFREGSGRRELAEAIASPANPLTSRVMVNRIWKHHFGNGIVRTVDNFGAMGERPSHPALLDHLASEFVASGWSMKALHRMIVLSNTYRLSSQPSPLALRKDPENKLLQYAAVRRLEAEAIRDSVLAVSGSLDRTVYGPSVRPHISPYQDGRGKPATGSLDGNGRRSIYIEVRRNFLTPLLLAFDYPPPVSTIGSRGITTVPSQALMMMNNEFVNQQAEKWAQRLQREFTDPKERIHRMFVEAYGRPPEPNELTSIDRFLQDQSAAEPAPQAWSDLAHVFFNSKEFLFVR